MSEAKDHDAARAALAWIERGYWPVPIPFREKGPVLKGWQQLRIDKADVLKHFSSASQNIGVLLGEPFGAADIDLDCPEALTAGALLAPATGLMFGHASKPASHRFYRSDPPMPSKKYLDPIDKTFCLCELRCLKTDGTGIGLQTVVPPSTHEETGEAIRFELGFDREAANIDGEELAAVVARIAAAALLARHWPKAGHGRHACEFALAGCLARAEWNLDDAEKFVLASYRAVADHDRNALVRVHTAIHDTFAKHSRGDETTGFTTLAAAVGDVVARTAAKWLGITPNPDRAHGGEKQARTPTTEQPGNTNAGPSHEGPGDSSLSRWPDPPSEEAFHGLAGEWVRLVEPHTEADPAALLTQFLVAFGSLIGRGPHFVAEADRHFTNLFTVIVGQTAKGRKGTSLGQVLAALRAIDSGWCNTRIMGGLSSGEGLIWAVRDEIWERVPIKENRRIIRYEEQVTDKGVEDKRVLVAEPEFASVLQRAERETNTLSAIIRQAWDTGSLQVLTKKQMAKATDAHVSMIGHITRDELRRLLNASETANGFANRFLWVCSKRSKCLPDGGALEQVDFSDLTRRLQKAADLARTIKRMERDDDARAVWHRVYADLSEGKPGLLGAVTSRAEAQVLRLSCLYALLDGSAVVRAEHLVPALALWQYCENSARFIFGDALGDATADEILRELRSHPEGMTRNDIREHFSRNKSAAEIGRAVGVLLEYGLARMVRGLEQEGQARPTERWFAVTGVRG